MNILSCLIDCLDYGDQTATAQESAKIGEDVSEEEEAEASNEVVQVRTSETAAPPHGLDEHRDPEINHYTCSTIDSQISMLTNDTYVPMFD